MSLLRRPDDEGAFVMACLRRAQQQLAPKVRETMQATVGGEQQLVDNVVSSYRDRFGVLQNVREGEAGLYADHHVPLKHPMAEQYLDDAENHPERVGFSIAAQGRGLFSRGLIESIDFEHVGNRGNSGNWLF